MKTDKKYKMKMKADCTPEGLTRSLDKLKILFCKTLVRVYQY